VLLSFAEEEPVGFAPDPILVLGVVALLFIVPAVEVLLGTPLRVEVAFVAGVAARVFGVAELPRSFAASSARVTAEGSVRTKLPVLACGTAFCVASLASWGVTPMVVVGVVAVVAVCAQAPPAVSANAAHKDKFFIE
jgi:hypothetical protein